MANTTLSFKEFDQDPKRARMEAVHGPVFISEHGQHAFDLLTIEEYRRIGGRGESLVDLQAMPGIAEVDFEPPRIGEELVRPADFS